MIKVIHPITRLIVGGAQENTLFTAALLDKTRYQVEVLCGPQTGSEGSLIEEARQRGISLTIMPEMLRQISPLNDLKAFWKLYRLFRQGGYTIVHTHSSKAGILGRLAAWLAGTPVIIHTVHGWSFHDHMSPLVRWTYILLERLCARLTHTLIAVAAKDIEKGLLAGVGRREQYRLIRSAIPLDEFEPSAAGRATLRAELGWPADAPVLGNVGRFSAQKNPLAWVQVAGRVGRALPECRFLLVGDGPLRPEVEAALAAEGIAGRTVLAGLRRDVGRWMSAMDVFLLTSLWEGLPRVIPEALSCGLPVVVTGVDGSQEAVQPGQTGYVCQPDDLDGLAAHCIELLSDPSLRAEFAARGRAYAAAEFDVRGMVRAIDAVYQAALPAAR